MSSILKGLILVGLLLFAYFTCLRNLKSNYLKAQTTLKRTSENYITCCKHCLNEYILLQKFDYTACKNNRHKYPAIQEALDRWVNDDTSMEFEVHFNKNILSTTLTTAKDARQCYQSKSLTSSQEDSLAKHMTNVNLSNSTPNETIRLISYHSKHPDSYEKCFGAAAILHPASTPDFLITALHIQANYKMTKNIWPALMALMAIDPNDFRPQGRFAHIFIPKYHLTSTKTTPLYHLTWQFCYAARQEAGI